MTKRKIGSEFAKQLRDRNTDPVGRCWLFVPYDQLNDRIGPLSREDPTELGIVVVESLWKATRRPYHKQKLALILANLRHFSLEQAERGVAVRHIVVNGPYRDALEPLAKKLGPLRVQRPAERELRVDLAPLIATGALQEVPHEGWLTTAAQFAKSAPKGPPFRMDAFYRVVRRGTGILMADDKPVGGKFSFDAENRRPWKGDPPAPAPLPFTVDAITQEVGNLIEADFPHHPGQLDLHSLPATKHDAAALWIWAKNNCLPIFGPFEDAMSSKSRSLFHTRLSSLMNLHRLLPSTIVREAADLDIELPCKEGFIRQILGWREFVHHVHDVTDGLRIYNAISVEVTAVPGDAGYATWSGKPWPRSTTASESTSLPDGGALPNHLNANQPLPPAFWGKTSGLNCLDRVVADVWDEGYSHHITRLMILANLATLLDVSPRELTDWFWVAYVDAYDWVVEPNVLGMGTYAVGDLMTTKPYVCGTPYIDRMSDYCKSCAFDPKKNCPISALYWAFLARHEVALKDNPRLAMPMRSLAKRSASQKSADRAIFDQVSALLTRGDRIVPEIL